MNWKTVERPGYFGKKRNELYEKWDKLYGKENWRIAWEWNNLIVGKDFAIQLYEDGYYEYFKNSKKVLENLIRIASDVYDTNISNIKSGLDYNIQETVNNHIPDIAIRRAILRNGKWFRGDHLMEVRGKGSEGEKLSPYLIPFHLPERILQKEIKDYGNKGKWWRELGIKYSIEELYQHNKVLQVK